MYYHPCEQPQNVFVPEGSRGGSGYSLSFCRDHKWTNLHSDMWKQPLWRRVIARFLLSHVFLIHMDDHVHFGCIYEWIAPSYPRFPPILWKPGANAVCADPSKPFQKIPQCVPMRTWKRTNGQGVNITRYVLLIISHEWLEGIILGRSRSPKTLHTCFPCSVRLTRLISPSRNLWHLTSLLKDIIGHTGFFLRASVLPVWPITYTEAVMSSPL